MKTDLYLLGTFAGLTLALISMHPIVWVGWALFLAALFLRFFAYVLRLI